MYDATGCAKSILQRFFMSVRAIIYPRLRPPCPENRDETVKVTLSLQYCHKGCYYIRTSPTPHPKQHTHTRSKIPPCCLQFIITHVLHPYSKFRPDRKMGQKLVDANCIMREFPLPSKLNQKIPFLLIMSLNVLTMKFRTR